MRDLSPATGDAVGGRTTRPLHLIEMELTPVVRISTNTTVTWRGFVWVATPPVEVSGLEQSGVGVQSATLTLGNVLNAYGSVVLGQQIADRRVRIWAADLDALGNDDPVLVFDGVIASGEVDLDNVTLSLAASGSGTRQSPRRYIEAASGFSVLIPAGTRITAGGETYILERAR